MYDISQLCDIDLLIHHHIHVAEDQYRDSIYQSWLLTRVNELTCSYEFWRPLGTGQHSGQMADTKS